MIRADDPYAGETDGYLAFFRQAAALKDTLRSGLSAGGRPESTAEHTWRLALMALALEETLPEIDCDRLIRMLLIHDLAEALTGDIPAPAQTGDKSGDERAAMTRMLKALPEIPARRIMALWEDYAAAHSPEARIAKGLDRFETLLHHVEGANPATFDYAFNLDYGREHTDLHPVIAALRETVDAETARRAASPRRDGVD